MTLEEKISQLGNDYGGACPAIPRLGVQANRWWNEALHGIARNGPATSFPTGLGLAATWDPEVVREMASMAADEGREKYNTEDHSMTALSYTRYLRVPGTPAGAGRMRLTARTPS